MATLKKMPPQAIIDGLKGTLDYYYWKDIPCVRKWPVWRPRTPGPAEAANQQDFAYINKAWKTLPANIKAQWSSMAGGTGLTGKDLAVRAYMKGANA